MSSYSKYNTSDKQKIVFGDSNIQKCQPGQLYGQNQQAATSPKQVPQSDQSTQSCKSQLSSKVYRGNFGPTYIAEHSNLINNWYEVLQYTGKNEDSVLYDDFVITIINIDKNAPSFKLLHEDPNNYFPNMRKYLSKSNMFDEYPGLKEAFLVEKNYKAIFQRSNDIWRVFGFNIDRDFLAKIQQQYEKEDEKEDEEVFIKPKETKRGGRPSNADIIAKSKEDINKLIADNQAKLIAELEENQSNMISDVVAEVINKINRQDDIVISSALEKIGKVFESQLQSQNNKFDILTKTNDNQIRLISDLTNKINQLNENQNNTFIQVNSIIDNQIKLATQLNMLNDNQNKTIVQINILGDGLNRINNQMFKFEGQISQIHDNQEKFTKVINDKVDQIDQIDKINSNSLTQINEIGKQITDSQLKTDDIFYKIKGNYAKIANNFNGLNDNQNKVIGQVTTLNDNYLKVTNNVTLLTENQNKMLEQLSYLNNNQIKNTNQITQLTSHINQATLNQPRLGSLTPLTPTIPFNTSGVPGLPGQFKK